LAKKDLNFMVMTNKNTRQTYMKLIKRNWRKAPKNVKFWIEGSKRGRMDKWFMVRPECGSGSGWEIWIHIL
jgi:hypothetical protein